MFKPISCWMILRAVIAVQSNNTSTRTSLIYDTYNNDSSRITMIIEEKPLKHESLKSCYTFDLQEDEYEMFPNKTAYVPAFNKTYEEEHYVLIGNILRICTPPGLFDLPASQLVRNNLSYIPITSMAVSMTFLFMYLLVFFIVPDLHDLPGCNLASLCLSLFLSYFLIILLWADDSPPKNQFACSTLPILTQFFLLGAFMWMFMMSFDVFRSILHEAQNLSVHRKGLELKKYIYNCLICWGTALVFIAAALIAKNVEGINQYHTLIFDQNCFFKSKLSFLSYCAYPVFVFICLIYLLGLFSFDIFTTLLTSRASSNIVHSIKHHLTYLRLAVIMSGTWVTGLLAHSWDENWLWLSFAVLTTFQGLFIFIAFTCTSEVKKYLKSNLLNRGRVSQETLIKTTFQPYCFDANSIEKYVGEIANSKVNQSLLIPKL